MNVISSIVGIVLRTMYKNRELPICTRPPLLRQGPCNWILGSSIIARWPKPKTEDNIVICGSEGMTTLGLRSSLHRLLPHTQPGDNIVIYCGSNDIFYLSSFEEVKLKLCDIFNVLRNVGCNIFYINLIKSPFMLMRKSREDLDSFEKLLENNYPFVSFLHLELNDDTDYIFDGLHLKQSGYDKLKDVIFKRVLRRHHI